MACSFRMSPMFSTREYIIYLNTLSEEIVDKKAYDVIVISEDDWGETYLDKYILMKNSPYYKEIYQTPYIKIFAKKDIPIESLINNWKFDLISEIKSSSISHNYIFSNFIDYSTILENAGILEPSELVDDIYQNKKIHYATLSYVNKQPAYQNVMHFVSKEVLERDDTYMLVFAAKSEENSGLVYVKTPADNHNQHTEIKVDSKLRLFMLPFKVNKQQLSGEFLIQTDVKCSIYYPILLKSPSGNSQEEFNEPIFQVNVNKYKFSYNPWVKVDDYGFKGTHSSQFLTKDKSIYRNPMVFLMKLFNFTIPADLYKYYWVSKPGPFSDTLVVRYE